MRTEKVFMMELKYAVLFALLILPIAAAMGGPSGMGTGGGNGNGNGHMGMEEAKGELIDSSFDNAMCKARFMTGVLESLAGAVNDSGELEGDLDALEADIEALQGYADAGDGRGYRDYLKGEYATHMREAREHIMSARKGVGGPLREQLRSEYESLRSEYNTCNEESLDRFSEAKVNAYEVALEKAQERADNLSGKGIDTDGLESLISDAREQVVDPLKAALDGAESGTDVRDALHDYCLYNGCKDGLNFHFEVKFEAEKLDSVLAAVSDEAADAGLSDDVSEAQADIDAASGAIEDAGTSQYTDGAGQDILENLRDAAQKIKDILRELRSG